MKWMGPYRRASRAALADAEGIRGFEAEGEDAARDAAGAGGLLKSRSDTLALAVSQTEGSGTWRSAINE
jgi:hypothetical protein